MRRYYPIRHSGLEPESRRPYLESRSDTRAFLGSSESWNDDGACCGLNRKAPEKRERSPG